MFVSFLYLRFTKDFNKKKKYMKIQNIDIPYDKVEYRNYKEFSLRLIIASSLTKCLTTEQKEDLCFHRIPILDRPHELEV